MGLRSLIKLCLAGCASAALSGCVTSTAEPIAFADAACNTPPLLRCPDGGECGALVIEQGPVQGPAPDRRYFIDYPCDLKQGEDITLVLNLHGGGSYGNWQRHYFPAVDYVDKYRMVVITPNAPPRVWTAQADDAYLQSIVTNAISTIGEKNIKSFWLAGHSQGSMTSRRIVCSDFFRDKVDGYLSLSGGRVGGAPTRSPAGFGPAPQAGAAAPATPAGPPAGGGAGGGAGAMAAAAPLDCDFSHIYTTGEHEIGALPETSDWAQKYQCGPRVRRQDVVDDKPGYVYDTSRQNPPTLGWGRPAAPGKAEVFDYPGCSDGRVVADVVRIDKGHTEGLEPNVTELLVRMMVNASGGKIARNAS